MRFVSLILLLLVGAKSFATVPVPVTPVKASHGIVVAGHPEAAEVGVAVLRAGGNAIDAGIATSLALGVAEPYGSGLGGKLMLLYYEAKTRRTFVVDAMDACGSAIDLPKYRRRGSDAHESGYSSVCVPGLPAGLWAAHQKWGARPWADDVQPAIELARRGAVILAKTRDLFAEQEEKLRAGDAEIARLYLPGNALPKIGTRLPNLDLARTLERFASDGRDGFYRGPVAEAIVTAAEHGGGVLRRPDFANYQPRITEPIEMAFRGYQIVAAPPPAWGATLFLPIMKALEDESFGGGPLRTAANLDLIGRVWRVVSPQASQQMADVPQARFDFERLIAPASIATIRAQALDAGPATRHVTDLNSGRLFESAAAATTHWIVVDSDGNIACCTQSLSLHFGAGVVAPGTGVVLNNSMSNFAFAEPHSVNAPAPGKRPRSTISPTLVFREGKPVLAIGIPGAARIPTALLQVLLDRLVLERPLADAIGDTRVHYAGPWRFGDPDAFEAERSLPAEVSAGLRARGWSVELPEASGRGRHFGGINAVEIAPDGTLTGFADPRRTNAAVGY